MLLLAPKQLSQKFGLQAKMLLPLQRAVCRGWSLEAQGFLQNLGQGSGWKLCTQSGPFGIPLSCPALQGARHITDTENEWMNGWVHEWTCWKQSTPAFLSLAYTSNDPVYSHLVEVTCHVLAVSGLWYMLGGYVFGVNRGTEVFNLLQNIGSSPNDPFLRPGLKFPP